MATDNIVAVHPFRDAGREATGAELMHANPYRPWPARITSITELTPTEKLFEFRFVDERIREAFRQEPGQFFGTGDLFAAVLLGSLLRGETLSESTARAVDFIQKSVARTLAAGTPMLEGVQFEPLLRELL